MPQSYHYTALQSGDFPLSKLVFPAGIGKENEDGGADGGESAIGVGGLMVGEMRKQRRGWGTHQYCVKGRGSDFDARLMVQVSVCQGRC